MSKFATRKLFSSPLVLQSAVGDISGYNYCNKHHKLGCNPCIYDHITTSKWNYTPKSIIVLFSIGFHPVWIR